jgi:hypothetical protein
MAKPPIFWNRAGDATQLATSVVGIDPTITGTPTYTSVKHGNGFVGSDANYIRIVGLLDSIRSVGAVEYWCNFVTAPIANDFKRGFSDEDGSNDFTVQFGGSGDATLHQFYINGSALNFTKSISNGDIIHLAFVWNTSGIDGGSNTRRVYIDGSSIATSDAALSNIDANAEDLWFGRYPTGGFAGNFAYDNMKVYDYDKVDYKDRFNERGGMNDGILIS